MKKITEKLNLIQTTLVVKKNQYNSFGKYSFRNAEDILESVKPLLKADSLILTLNDDIKIVGDRIYVVATATLSDGTDSISTTALAREPVMQKGMNESQITGSASSYARKYALNGLFAIDDVKDADTINKRIDDANSVVLIDVKQRETLALMIQNSKTDLGKFNESFGVSKLTELPASEFNKAFAMLQSKLNRLAKKQNIENKDENNNTDS